MFHIEVVFCVFLGFQIQELSQCEFEKKCLTVLEAASIQRLGPFKGFHPMTIVVMVMEKDKEFSLSRMKG